MTYAVGSVVVDIIFLKLVFEIGYARVLFVGWTSGGTVSFVACSFMFPKVRFFVSHFTFFLQN